MELYQSSTGSGAVASGAARPGLAPFPVVLRVPYYPAAEVQMEPGSEADEARTPPPDDAVPPAERPARRSKQEKAAPRREEAGERATHGKLAGLLLVLVVAGLVAHWWYGPFTPSLPLPGLQAPSGSEMTISPLADALPESAIAAPERAEPPAETVTFHEGSLSDELVALPGEAASTTAAPTGAELGDIIPLDEGGKP